jgi:hypothetical protein
MLTAICAVLASTAAASTYPTSGASTPAFLDGGTGIA